MEQPTPEWLTKAFLSTCLKGDNPKGPAITVTSYDVEQGVAPGNNYGSVILRVKVKYEENNIDKSESLIVKGPLSSSLMDRIVELFGLAEYNFYYVYIPVLNSVIKEKITAKEYFTPMKSVIVLEDLKATGFSMADRHEQLDYNHCKQYFTASAKFHAAGVFIAKQNPELLKVFPGMFEKMSSGDFAAQMKLFMHDAIIGYKCLVKSLESLDLDEYKTYIDIIKKFIEMSESTAGYGMNTVTFTNLIEVNKKQFKSFIHGDCWTTNMMFKHDTSGDPIDIRLLDFQGFRHDTVVNDIINFTWMSANNDVLEHNLEDLYHIYCSTLNTELAKLGCPERLSYERLKEELYEMGSQILMMSCMLLPLTQGDELLDTQLMFTGRITEDDVMKFYKGKHFYKKFPRMLKFIADQGVFDRLEKDIVQWDQFTSSGLSIQ